MRPGPGRKRHVPRLGEFSAEFRQEGCGPVSSGCCAPTVLEKTAIESIGGLLRGR